MSKLYCANCGNSLDENALFCGSCGEKVKFHPTADQLVDENAAAGEKPVISEIAFDKNPYEDRFYAEEGNEPYEYEDPYQEEDFGGAAGPYGNGNRKNHLPVLLITAGAAAVAVLVLLIASLGGKSVKTSSGNQNGQNTTSTGSAANTHAAGSEDVEGTRRMVTARAEEVKTIYAQQIASYNDDSDSEVRRVDDTTCYYVDKNLVEVDVPKGHNGSPYHCEYYYRGGDVYYIRVYETINEITELYYENRVLVGWRDPQGYFHDAQSDADIYQQWNIYVDESRNTYNYYENTETNTQNTEYILVNSASKYLSAVDVQNLSAEELRLARNEIFARHGRTFRDAELQSYFDSCSWYSGTVDPDTFDSQKGNILSAVEQANLALIQEMENSGKVTSTAAQDAAEAEAKEMAEIASEAEAESTAAPAESTT
ncbi:MAG: YARHG domain-containing protein, partial [Lachnospiraceae bacterium]|nr:YARHG domain-containing protein [Lachnospiraceae bacterium]